MEARHQNRALGHDLTARERRPEHVRREHQRPVLVAAVEQVMEEIGDAKVVVDPALLLGDRQRLSGEDARVERRPFDPRRVDDGLEPPHGQGTVDRHAFGELVGPGEVVAGARGEDLDGPAPIGESPSRLRQHRLGAADHARPVAGRHEADTTGALHRHRRVSGTSAVPGTRTASAYCGPTGMDICVCGAQVPFMYGGAEQLLENLVGALRAAGHRADLVRLPAAWERERVFDSAMAWRMLPIDADLVIATNFPSYFVRHPRKVVWLFHQHRVAYDLAGSELSDFDLDDGALEEQRLLVEWDTRALEEATVRYTLSAVVSDRLARYNGLTSTPLPHPPPHFDRLHPAQSDGSLFTALRLERNKRPELLVDAMAEASSGLTLHIAGTGSLHDELAARIERHGLTGRVHLLGWAGDDEIVERYEAARAVLYTPYDEDYGYVTLQAFAAGKPVLTTSDAGAVLEWVTDGVNGLVADPTPKSLAAAIDRIATDDVLTQRLGKAARERVSGLSWEPVVDTLLAGAMVR
jgi:glycosyltransferase involved in cell wall biosynthesis